MRRFPFWLFAVGLSLCVPPSRAQSAPGVINYQGRLTDNTPQQAGVSAALPMQFSLWDAASGGTSLWREPASGGVAVTVTNGIFSVSLGGNGVPLGGTLFAGGTDRWLQITLHPGTASEEILQPRQRLAASAWAHSAAQAGDSANLGGIAPAGWQTRVGGACQPGSGIRRIYADGTVDCQVDSTGTLYSAGVGLTLTGSQFSVNFDGGGTAATAARSDHAHAAPALRALTVTRYGPGLVASDRPGIYCGGSCAGQFNDGETVTLSATPEPGGGFSGWTGACSGTASCVVTMSAARSVGAVFSAPLAVQKSGTGSGTVVSTPAGINCGSSCAAAFGAGAMVTLTAAPASDSQFAGWLGACSGAGPCTVTMDGAKSVAAIFLRAEYLLMIRNSGNGGGTVSSVPAGLSCDPTCLARYAGGAPVTLTATPDANSVFAGWSGGGCSGTGTCVVTMIGDLSVEAAFARPSRQLNLWVNGPGTVTSLPTGILCNPACSDSFPANSTVTLSAHPDAGAAFYGWSGGGCSGTGSCVVTMNAPQSILAQFKIPLTVAKSGTGSGLVVSSPAGINCGATCSAGFDPQQLVTLTGTPDANSDFTGWTGACSGTGSCMLAMDSAKSVGANFALKTPTLSVTPSGTGYGIVTSSPAGINCGATCAANFDYGTIVMLTAAPGATSTFAGWSGGGCSGTGTCNVAMTAAANVSATFTLNSYALSVTRSGLGTGTVTSSPAGINCGSTCSANYNHGTVVTLTAAAGGGSTFAGWSGACTGTGTCLVSMTAAASVTATFTLNSYALSVTRSGSGTGTVTSSPAGINCGSTCIANYAHGTLVQLTAAPSSSSTFAGWSGACTGTGSCIVSMTAATGVTANFTLNSYTLTVSKSGAGSGTVTSNPAGINCGATCAAPFNHGTVVTLSAAANAGSAFAGWSGGGCSGTGTCVINMTAALTVTATFN